jgi:hypothetical protein
MIESELAQIISTHAIASLICYTMGFIFWIWFICKVFGVSKSKEYRELLSDMYVVGRIKQYAAEDKVDLKVELREFARIVKKSKLKYKNLDEAIEDELKEKVARVQEEKESK